MSAAGFWGSAGFACGGGVVSDLFVEKDRAFAMSVFSLGPLIGPAVGPLAGGFLTESVGFKWIFILLAALCGFAALLGIPFFRETYTPVIRARLARRHPNIEAGTGVPVLATAAKEEKFRYIWVNIHRPFILLTRSIICFLLSLYLAL